MTPCALKGCKNSGHYTPVLVMRHHVNASPTVELVAHGLFICDEHKQSATVETFLCDAGFQQVSDAVVRIGRKPPVRELTQLKWLMITNG